MYILLQDWKSPFFKDVIIPKGIFVNEKNVPNCLAPYYIEYQGIKETFFRNVIEHNPTWFKKVQGK